MQKIKSQLKAASGKQKLIVLMLLMLLTSHSLLLTNALAEDKPTKGENTGLPIPRWASLKSNKINARSGPGDNYPVKAVYKRAGLPVEIVNEFKLWREVVDVDGEHNWVHKAMLSGNRTAIVKEDIYAYQGSNPSAKLEKNSQISISECTATQCKLKMNDVSGWVDKSKLWGVYPNEIFD
jgi:SH3-like domain-containing protein